MTRDSAGVSMGVQSCGTEDSVSLCLNLDTVDQITEGDSGTWAVGETPGSVTSSEEEQQRGDGDAAAPDHKSPACYSA